MAANVLARTRVGMITSKADVIAATSAYVKKLEGDASPASVKKVLARYAAGKSCLDQAAVQRFLNDADACAPWPISCDGTAKKIVDAVDKNGDRCVDWEEFRVAAGFPPDPAPPPPAPIASSASPSGLSDRLLTIAVLAGAASLPPESVRTTSSNPPSGGLLTGLGLAAVAVGALVFSGARAT